MKSCESYVWKVGKATKAEKDETLRKPQVRTAKAVTREGGKCCKDEKLRKLQVKSGKGGKD